MRILKLGLCTGVAAAAMIAGLQAPAWASTEYLWTSGGYGLWSADPSSGDPGDAIKACDTSSDGWAIQVTLNWGDATHTRTIDTRGHQSGYCTGWATGDIAESETVDITVQQVKLGDDGKLHYQNPVHFQRQA